MICESGIRFEIATENGLKYSFTPNEEETDIHPNTVDIIMTNTAGQEMTIRGESLGGGKVHITQINHVEVDFTGEYSAIIVVQKRCSGCCCLDHQLSQRPTGQYCFYASVS